MTVNYLEPILRQIEEEICTFESKNCKPQFVYLGKTTFEVLEHQTCLSFTTEILDRQMIHNLQIFIVNAEHHLMVG